MSPAPNPDRDALLMMLSAYLDGELTPAEETQVLDAMSQDPELLEAFEALCLSRGAAARVVGAQLSSTEGDALTASIMASTAPAEVPENAAGVWHLANLAADDAIDAAGAARLDAVLPSAPDVVVGFVASLEATQATLRGVSSLPLVAESLRSVPDHVDAQVAALERVGALTSAAIDDALTPAELVELGERVDVNVVNAMFCGEALRFASAGPAFARLGARAGAAALHAIEAEAVQAAKAAAKTEVRKAERTSWLASTWGFFSANKAPFAFAGAAFALFFVLRSEPAADTGANTAQRDKTKQELLDAAARNLLAEAPVGGHLPLLADNSAEVQAIDTTGTTVVFSTEASNITVIWVASDEDEETGT